ncbi:hypothetical protein NM688_g5874 [Phlebia brevispora]|uniref:Uncharacterized protein n=1 Tax=Phlebia brevispora TaxID=194682 RepID=A0ACC1SN99_9APHY|nr:hypothetical protein NM688_g5874 [Phlebia brevispora]
MAVKSARRRRRPRPLDDQSDPEISEDEGESGGEEAVEVPDAAGRYPTPIRMQAPSDHDRKSIHPYVREDLRHAKHVGFFVWTEAVLGLSQTKLLSRAREIGKLRWFEDSIIQNALIDYCRVTSEKRRYDPFIHLVNRIVELASGKLPGVDKVYPIKDFCIANNADRVVKPISEHGSMGAKRRPDFLGLSATNAVKLYTKGGSVEWKDILFFGELKYVSCISEMLSKERQLRDMSHLDKEGFPPDVSRVIRKAADDRHGLFANKPTGKKTRKRAPKSAKQTQTDKKAARTAPSRVRAGRKRLAEDDLLAGLDVPSSSKRRNPWGTTNELYVGGVAAVQSGAYALELLSCTYGTRVHCFSFVVKNDKMSLWYYDSSGVIYTKEFISIVEDFETFAAVIVGFACCSTEQFGVLPSSVLKAPTPSPRTLLPADLQNRTLTMTLPVSKTKVAVTLQKPLFTQYTLTGRRSFLYTIKTTTGMSTKDMIIKFSYQVCTRKAEQDLVSIARTAGVKHLPRIHMWAELWKLSEGARRVFLRKSKGKADFEDRTLRAIVYTQYASIKELFTQHCELIPVMVDQMIDCLHDLRYKANMLHRDISVNNIMYQMRSGRHYFILIDFDMAIVLPSEGEFTYIASSIHRTGTLPFMAYELIFNAAYSRREGWRPIPHLLRHDYESLFWLALWCVLTLLTQGLSEIHAEELLEVAKEFEMGGLRQISGAKYDLCTMPIEDYDIKLPPAAQPLAAWFRAWGETLLETATMVRRQKFRSYSDDGGRNTGIDWETAGGIFTKEKLKPALLAAFPISEDAAADMESEDELDLEAEAHRRASSELPGDDASTVAPPKETAKPKRATRTRQPRAPKQTVLPPENDIRARLRPRKPRVYT